MRIKTKEQEPPGFAAFYAAYPRKRGREDAKRAFRKTVAKLGRRALLEFRMPPEEWLAVKAFEYAEASKHKERKHLPYPATWLNKGCYDDELDDLPPKPTQIQYELTE